MIKKKSVKKISGPKKFWGKKILSQKNFGLIDLNPKFVLSNEKTGRVNPRWRISSLFINRTQIYGTQAQVQGEGEK